MKPSKLMSSLALHHPVCFYSLWRQRFVMLFLVTLTKPLCLFCHVVDVLEGSQSSDVSSYILGILLALIKA